MQYFRHFYEFPLENLLPERNIFRFDNMRIENEGGGELNTLASMKRIKYFRMQLFKTWTIRKTKFSSKASYPTQSDSKYFKWVLWLH